MGTLIKTELYTLFMYMGNTVGKIIVDVKPRTYNMRTLIIPYSKLQMLRVLQREFDYEVKGAVYVDHEYKFMSFEVRSNESAVSSYGAHDWRIYFHTHPDKTAQKYGIRYFSPPSVDDVIDIYEQSTKFIPMECAFGEISIIITNEGIYVMRVARALFKEFNKDNLPIEVLELMLRETLTPFMVKTLKEEMIKYGKGPLNLDDPDISYDDYIKSVKTMTMKLSKDFGFHIDFHGWTDLEKNDGLTLEVSEYFFNKKVTD